MLEELFSSGAESPLLQLSPDNSNLHSSARQRRWCGPDTPCERQNWEDSNGRGEESLLLTRKCQASSQQVEEAAQELWEGPAEEATCLVDSVSVQAWDGRGDLRVEASALLCCHGRSQSTLKKFFSPMTAFFFANSPWNGCNL
ncbi:hypothetical protein ACRRTK_021516 [Alexandromys fortis]